MRMMIAQAPWVNLVAAMTRHTTADRPAPMPLMTRPTCQLGSFLVTWCLAMPDCDSVKLEEHADGVERDELVDLGVGHEQQHDGGDGQRDDAVGEHQPVAALGELAGHEVVAGVEAGQAGEVGEAGVGGQHEDERRARSGSCRTARAADAAVAEHRLADLGDDRRRARLVGHRVDACQARTDTVRNIAAGDEAHDDERRCGRCFHAGSLKAGTPLEMASTPVTAAPPEAKALRTIQSAGAGEQTPCRRRRWPKGTTPSPGSTVPSVAGDQLVERRRAPSRHHVEHEEVGGDRRRPGPTP